MGFQKQDLTSSVNSEEKISTDITEKDSDEKENNDINHTSNSMMLVDNNEVSI